MEARAVAEPEIQQETERSRDFSNARAIFKGALGGLVGSWMIEKTFSILGSTLVPATDKLLKTPPHDEKKENPTLKVAKTVAQSVGVEIPKEREALASGLVHYGFGATVGAVYGLMAERAGKNSFAQGVKYGTAVWLFADEMALPVMKLSGAPWTSPISEHLSGLIGHWIYGLTLEAAREIL